MFSLLVLLLPLSCFCRGEEIQYPGNNTDWLTRKTALRPPSSWLPVNVAPIADAPYHAAIVATDESNGANFFLCSGVLISPLYVLSESSCIDVSVSNNNYSLSVVLGAAKLTTQEIGLYSVSATIKYKSLVLLVLNEAVNLIKGRIETVKLAKPSGIVSSELEYIGTEGKLSGWNISPRTELVNYAPDLYLSRHWVSSQGPCKLWMRNNLYEVLQNTVCTRVGRYEKCTGNMGSPLVGSSRRRGGDPVLIGLARYNMQSCRINPIIYDFIPNYYSWIERELGIART